MDTKNSSSWSSTLLSVIYGISTRQSTVTKTTPYALMFEQAPLISELSVDACSHSLISTPTKHFAICTVVTDHYLATANKKIKLHQDNLKLMGCKFELNDCVNIEIHSVDGTNTDPKYLPCIIIEKYERNNILLFKLIWSV
ncbi:unnamed protein product [Adineta steineri]|uniref:Uncharacterized protein n=2 Tax=Adineta steineri TaxID=433720 RepID=A0A815L366_9BILA|nr:unnamed protein product [Adineta steineri]